MPYDGYPFGLPLSFFFFEVLLWLIILLIPVILWALYRYKVFILPTKVKRWIIYLIVFLGAGCAFAAGNVWLLVGSGFDILVILYLEPITKYLRKPLYVLLPLVWGTVLYGSFIEPQQLVVREVELEIADLPSMRIALVADLHVGPYKGSAWIEKVVETINAQKVDAVMIPGDFFYGRASKYARALAPLKDLQAPTFVTLGNHDHAIDPVRNRIQSEAVNAILTDLGHPPMNNTARYAEDLGVWVVGVDDNDLGYDDLEEAYEEIRDKRLGDKRSEGSILLAHSPDIVDELRTAYSVLPTSDVPSLILSGHTHCGQIRLPGLGALPLTIPTRNGKKYEGGHYVVDFSNANSQQPIANSQYGSHLFITCGVGEVGTRARLFNPPEVVVLDIKGD